MIDPQPFILSFKLAFIVTGILLLAAIPIAYWLAYTKSRLRILLGTLVTMPLVLPPSVLGFYLLLAFSPLSGFGKFLQDHFDIRLAFSFGGLVIASVLYSLPFMVGPIQAGLQSLPAELRQASYSLGKSGRTTLFRILLPNIRSSLVTGIVLSFAHTIGEFGVVLMIGGNIPGQTRLASIAIYDHVEMMQYGAAGKEAILLFLLSFCIVLTVYLVNQKFKGTLSR
ncbi:MAG: molybdate ABC transporter permease subunit [Puia sp.]|nr:molybdate ABC transporter permease subunit [Puia sp.]